MNFVKNIYKTIYGNRKLCLAIIDIFVIVLSYCFAHFILYDEFIDREILIKSIFTGIIVYSSLFYINKIYSSITRYETGKDYLVYILLSAISALILSISDKIFNLNLVTFKMQIFTAIIIAVFMISYRIVIRLILNNKEYIMKSYSKDKCSKRNVLIIGAGSSARNIINTINNQMKSEYNIIGMIDDNRNKIGYNISGVKVLGNRNCIQDICENKNVEYIFFTISKISSKDKQAILNICQLTNARIRILPSTEEFIKNSKSIVDNLKDVDIEDILCRDQITLDNNNIVEYIRNKVVLITGAGGSIGSELCRQIIKYDPKKLIILDVYENTLYDIEVELKNNYDLSKIEAVITSVRDEKALEQAFKNYRPNVVFHAAAHKHVPLMESCPKEAIKNNVLGTYNVVQICDKYNVDKCVLISSDKAVNPSNIMGATKRLCEMIVQAKNRESKTEYIAVRFGNVIGSNGSVIPLFKKQILAGGPLTVTHKNITRYFMTIPEAVGLILQAVTYANGGEIFVLDMGQPVKIYDLAVNLIKLSGLKPDVDISIEIVGLRPGEKLYEELLMSEEGLAKTNHEKIFIAKPLDISMKEISRKINDLNKILENDNSDENQIKDTIKKVVPTYIRKIEENNHEEDIKIYRNKKVV